MRLFNWICSNFIKLFKHVDDKLLDPAWWNFAWNNGKLCAFRQIHSKNEYFWGNKDFAGNTRLWKQGMYQNTSMLVETTLNFEHWLYKRRLFLAPHLWQRPHKLPALSTSTGMPCQCVCFYGKWRLLAPRVLDSSPPI